MHPYEKAAKKSRERVLRTYQTGGAVTGMDGAQRMDKRSRSGKTDVAIIVNAGGKDQALQQGLQAGMKIGAALGARGGAGGPPPTPAAAPMAPPAPMAGPPPGPMAGGGMGAPPGMPPVAAASSMGPMRRPPGMQRGGAVKLTAGAGGGKGRIEKANDYGVPKVQVREHVRRKAGGRIG